MSELLKACDDWEKTPFPTSVHEIAAARVVRLVRNTLHVRPGLGMTPPERTDALMRVLQSWAPDQAAYTFCEAIVETMRGDGCTEDEVNRYLCEFISDGLRCGNWPWLYWESRKHS